MDFSISFYEELFKKRSTHIRYDLSRIQSAAAMVGFKALDIPCVLIGGTNGKGSCAAFLWTILSEFKLKVGLFTSPHMFGFEERFLICNSKSELTSNDIFQAYISVQKELADKSFVDLNELSFFEWSMLIALRIFSDFAVDFIVWEVGMGGRLDATNITNPLVSIVTSIGMDHMEFLGATIEAITKEKLGISRKNKPLIFGKSAIQKHNELSYPVVQEHAKFQGIKDIYFFEKDFFVCENLLTLSQKHSIDAGIDDVIDLDTMQVQLPDSVRARGEFLVQSLAIALQALLLLKESTSLLGRGEEFQTKLTSILQSFDSENEDERPPWPTSVIGRFQKLKMRESIFYVDVAHNADGIRAILERIDESWVVCVSILKDKDFSTMLDILKSKTKNILLFACDHERSWREEDVRKWDVDRTSVFYQDISSLWQLNKDLLLNLSANKKNVLFCGSVLAMAKVIEFFQAKPVSHRWNEVLVAKVIK